MIEQHRRGDFGDLAGDYERYRTGYSSELFDVLENLGVRRGSNVLDAGCGTGLATEPLLARGIKVTGLDSSPAMLAAARARLPAATFVDGTVEAMPFPAAGFDAAISAQTFHWFDAARAYAELIRVVKAGGPIAVWWKILGSDDALRTLRAAACRRVGVEPVSDPLRGGFGAFYQAPFASRTLRVVPFIARLCVDDWIGYERSRALARDAYGARRDAYLDALRDELQTAYGSPQARMEIRYTQFLYVGRTAQ